MRPRRSRRPPRRRPPRIARRGPPGRRGRFRRAAPPPSRSSRQGAAGPGSRGSSSGKARYSCTRRKRRRKQSAGAVHGLWMPARAPVIPHWRAVLEFSAPARNEGGVAAVEAGQVPALRHEALGAGVGQVLAAEDFEVFAQLELGGDLEDLRPHVVRGDPGAAGEEAAAEPGEADAERVAQAAPRFGDGKDDDRPLAVPGRVGGRPVDALPPGLEQLPSLGREPVPAAGAHPLGGQPPLAGHPGEDGPHGHRGEPELPEEGDQPAGPDRPVPLQQVVAEEGEDEVLGPEARGDLSCHIMHARMESDI